LFILISELIAREEKQIIDTANENNNILEKKNLSLIHAIEKTTSASP